MGPRSPSNSVHQDGSKKYLDVKIGRSGENIGRKNVFWPVDTLATSRGPRLFCRNFLERSNKKQLLKNIRFHNQQFRCVLKTSHKKDFKIECETRNSRFLELYMYWLVGFPITVVTPNKTIKKFSEKKTNKARTPNKACKKVPLLGVIVVYFGTNMARSALI